MTHGSGVNIAPDVSRQYERSNGVASVRYRTVGIVNVDRDRGRTLDPYLTAEIT